MDLMSKGGGEAVAMNVLEALQGDYDVTLLTLTDPDIAELNDYFNTNVDAATLDVDRAGVVAPTINRTVGLKYYVLQNALLSRYARRHAAEYDLLISTINELGLGDDSIQYVHFPFDWTVSLDTREHIFHPTVEEESPYERLCTRVAGVTKEEIRSQRLFANSRWTADVFEDAYGTEPEVLYPPIDTSEFSQVPWDDRDAGFVTVGRIERSKRIVEMIEVIDELRERGHDLHLHVIGPTVDEAYYEEVAAKARGRSYIDLEGELPREELVERICTHKYGIHGKRFEHFGMAVAELAAGGTLPFVPSDGGQHAIVRDDDRLQFDSPADAVDTIDRVLSDPALQRDLRFGSDEIERRFGRERFKRAIRAAVSEQLERPEVDPTGTQTETQTTTEAERETPFETRASAPAKDD
jgi:glycosyltransferase involved in cell wall biosynthesis